MILRNDILCLVINFSLDIKFSLKLYFRVLYQLLNALLFPSLDHGPEVANIENIILIKISSKIGIFFWYY